MIERTYVPPAPPPPPKEVLAVVPPPGLGHLFSKELLAKHSSFLDSFVFFQKNYSQNIPLF